MNRVCLCGRITKDLELNKTSSGKSVCNFTIAINRDKDNADFIDIQTWNEQADNLCKYQGKGSLIGIDGALRKDVYTREDGTKASRTYVLANHIEYLSSKTTQDSTQEATQDEDPYAEFGESVTIDDNFLD